MLKPSLQARDEGTVSNVTFRNIIINGTRQWPGLANASGQEWGGWWGSGENIWISTMPRTATSLPGHVQNITFENVWGVGQVGGFKRDSSCVCVTANARTPIS